MRAKLEILAMVLGFLGLFGAVAATAMPMWRVSAFIGANLIVMEVLWEGLWMNCFNQADIKMQCKVYDSLLILSPELQAARGLMVVSIVLVVIALFIAGFTMKRTNCCEGNERAKNITLAFAGSLFLLACLITLIPVCWVAHTVIRNFYNPVVVDSRKRELGASLFIGWATCAFLLATGVILLLSYSKRRSKEYQPYAGGYLTTLPTDAGRASSVHSGRAPSSFHKHHEYV
ncbi:claudin-17-like [Dunckerocampus dactyliophorus]|uniref:claudin-17-like n=1 Tax=Dunckerocampus dactyliophorus TaxID=161453 RepID=UPI0024055D49|nr:claudin-17-like [Dunckerocampus dactyliophorus]